MKVIKNYEKAVQALAEEFSKKYFDNEHFYWACDRIGDLCCFNGYCFNVDRMVEALELNASKDDLIDYWELENPKINFRNYIKYPEMRVK